MWSFADFSPCRGLGKKREPELVWDSIGGADSLTGLDADSVAEVVIRDSNERGASVAGSVVVDRDGGRVAFVLSMICIGLAEALKTEKLPPLTGSIGRRRMLLSIE